ncbi:uncharacterized protein LOC107304790 [Oryza brachyantha]|uniref:uncharacterized protein LOC107304790 n=1 Tax=Oryza brachyantha TaxID=4533 RepID=UPI001ADB7E49|nr:uncharacterized protein LOC107304790 [Oryza brachyantha]
MNSTTAVADRLRPRTSVISSSRCAFVPNRPRKHQQLLPALLPRQINQGRRRRTAWFGDFPLRVVIRPSAWRQGHGGVGWRREELGLDNCGGTTSSTTVTMDGPFPWFPGVQIFAGGSTTTSPSIYPQALDPATWDLIDATYMDLISRWWSW